VPGYTLDDGVTLKNTLGAISHDALETAESDFVANRLLQLELGHGPAGQFDAAHLKAIHRHLFQDVYEWAGHTRDEKVALSDGTVATEPLLRKVDGSPFMAGPLEFIPICNLTPFCHTDPQTGGMTDGWSTVR